MLSSAAIVMRLACASPIPKPHSTTTHMIRRACTEASCFANRKVLHSATNTLMIPNNIAEMITVANNPHEQWNFQADENPYYDDQGVHQKLKPLSIGKG